MQLIGISIMLVLSQLANGFIVQEPIQNASLHEMYTALKLEIETISAKSANLRKDYNTIKLENENLTKGIADLEGKAKSAERELANATQENAELKTGLGKASTQLLTMQKNLESLNSTNQLLTQQYSVLNNQYLEVKRNCENFPNLVNNTSGSQKWTPRIGFSVSWPEREPYGVPHTGPLKFTNTFYDDYSVYNQTTGEFVCKTPGLYFFSSMIIRQVGEHTAASCYIMVNDMTLTYLEGYSFNSSYGSPSGTGTALYHMQEGDAASIGNCTNPKQISGFSNFNGFLLDAD